MVSQDGRLLASSCQHSEYRLMYSSGVPEHGGSREPSSLYRIMSTVSMRPSHGIFPLDISHSITPRLNISDFFPRLYDSLKDAGSLYAGVPSPCDLDIICFNTLDKPKSVIFATP